MGSFVNYVIQKTTFFTLLPIGHNYIYKEIFLEFELSQILQSLPPKRDPERDVNCKQPLYSFLGGGIFEVFLRTLKPWDFFASGTVRYGIGPPVSR